MRNEMGFAPGPHRPCRFEADMLEDIGSGNGGRDLVGQRPATVLFDSNRNGFVTSAVEMLEDRRGRRDRHLMFAGPAAVDDAYAKLLHNMWESDQKGRSMPASACSTLTVLIVTCQ